MVHSSAPPRDAACTGAERPAGASTLDQVTALARVGHELTSRETLAEGFAIAMRLLDEGFGVKRSALFVVDDEKRTLAVELAYGTPPESLRPRYGLGVAGRVAECGRPIVVPAVRQEPMASCELADPAWHPLHLSLVSVPVCAGGRCYGALSGYFVRGAPDGFEMRVSALEVVASLIAQRLRAAHPATAEEPPPKAAERGAFEYANMIGTSAVIRQVYEEIGQVARTTATALILGESGTGKELVAQAIHANSDRARQPFIQISGAAFPETLFESELFGHERGAFTGAVSRKKGRLDLAQGGTLLLDEIGELPLSTQVKLLRVLQSREYERLGGTETLTANVRLVAATNRNMAQSVASGAFREDLYYRLNVFTITLPPLRERVEDVPALAEHFLARYAALHRRKISRIASGAQDVLARYAWPGNVRELENAIERAVVVCDGFVVEKRHLPESVRTARHDEGAGKPSLAEAVQQLERQMIEDALRQTGGNLARASRTLGMSERVVRYKVRKYRMGSFRDQ
ncbi:MAG: sigma 54-interacting transcriptional regulator [Polyangiaceae bacterium]